MLARCRHFFRLPDPRSARCELASGRDVVYVSEAVSGEASYKRKSAIIFDNKKLSTINSSLISYHCVSHFLPFWYQLNARSAVSEALLR